LSQLIDLLEIVIILEVELEVRYVILQQISNLLVWTHPGLEPFQQLLQELTIQLPQLNNIRLQDLALLVTDDLLLDHRLVYLMDYYIQISHITLLRLYQLLNYTPTVTVLLQHLQVRFPKTVVVRVYLAFALR
jgi:hypothetical protein